MKKILFLVCLLFLAGTAWAVSLIGSGVGDECTGALICQNFEGTGYDNGETWTEVENNGSIDEDYTGVILRGSQSCRFLCNDYQAQTATITFTDQSYVSLHLIVELKASPTDYMDFILFYNNTTLVAKAWIRPTNIIDIQPTGGSSGYGTTVLTNNSTFHLWFDYMPSDGGDNGTMRYYVATNGTKPTAEITVNNGTNTLDVNKLTIRAAKSCEFIIDQVIEKNIDIGDIPE